jgi:hypothetical protein
MPSPSKVKGQYSTLPSDIASPHYPRQPSPLAGSGYNTPETESSAMLHAPPESGQQSPVLDSSSSELGLMTSPRPGAPVAVSPLYRHTAYSA